MAKNRNATFLFYRNFMEYHQDRFEDASLLFFNQQKLVGILPGHRVEKRFCSHRGLTYAGLILNEKMGISEIESIFNQLLIHLKKSNFDALEIKIIPAFYQEKYGSAIEYLLFQKGAKLLRRDLNFLIDLQAPLVLSKNKKQISKKGIPPRLSIEKTTGFDSFWNNILIPALRVQYNTQPVHNLKEISLLANRFPDNIQQYQADYEGKCVAGITLFVDKKTVKTQYVAANETGKKINALDYLYVDLLKKFKQEDFRYFDLGHTNTDSGTKFNSSLTLYKERLGGRPVNADCYLLNL